MARHHSTAVLCFFVVAALAATAHAAATVHGAIVDVPPAFAKGTGRLSVDGGAHVAFADDNGHFVFPALEAGSHVVDITLGDLVFPQLRIDVSDKSDRYRATYNDGSGRVLVNAMNDGTAADAAASVDADHPLVQVGPVGRHNYYIPREHFSIMHIVKNPMILMMVVSLGLVYVMPLIADQDEVRAQMRDMQKQATGIQQQAAAPPAAGQAKTAGAVKHK